VALGYASSQNCSHIFLSILLALLKYNKLHKIQKQIESMPKITKDKMETFRLGPQGLGLVLVHARLLLLLLLLLL